MRLSVLYTGLRFSQKSLTFGFFLRIGSLGLGGFCFFCLFGLLRCFRFGSFFLLLLFLEVGDAVLNQDVVPLYELLDVTDVYAVTVKVGEHLGEVLTQLVVGGFLEVDAGLLALLQCLHALQHYHERHVFVVGEHGDVGQ